MLSQPTRIAMWSGPRNISTALMRSFESRGDCFVSDEPLYAHYLATTGVDHPMAAEVIEQDDADWRSVVDRLIGEVPSGQEIWYQKHMAHHLLPSIERSWLDELKHAFLIRDPAEMISSLANKLKAVTLEDTGFPQQVELFRRMCDELGEAPPVIDSRDVLENPARVLAKLCEALGIEFTERMLRWSPGRRATDGVWASYWYDVVERSSGFGRYQPKSAAMPNELVEMHGVCQDLYHELYACRIV